jgi:signal transduction histidine kinase
MGGRSVLVGHVDDNTMRAIAETEEHFELLKKAHIRSIMSVPMVARGHTQGVLTFALSHRHQPFDATDLMLGEELARRAALSVDNARLYSEAQQAVRLRDDFLCIASHELRTPLTTLGLQADSALRTIKQTQTISIDTLTGKLHTMRKQMERLDYLIQGLLDASRIVTGRLELHPESTDLSGLTEEVAQRFAEEAHRADCKLHLSLQPDVVGVWDRLRLEQLITNLITNAIKYGRERPIDIGLEQSGDLALLWVRDRGIGIAPENHERIFGRFERAASQRNYGGLGLGLWIVRQILDAMGGTIRLESALGSGSTFIVELPCGNQ